MTENRADSTHASAIERSLEIAGERGGDLTPRVYALLFQRQPDVEQLFSRDKNSAVRGEMLARVFEMVLDFVGERRYAHHLVHSEMLTHEGYDVPRGVFVTFFDVVLDVVRETCGTEWTEDMNIGWRLALRDLARCIEDPMSIPTIMSEGRP